MINGLLCSELRALTRTSATDLSPVIVRQVTQEEIKKAWHQLFTFFKDVECKTQKKNVIDITRATTGALADDILKQLSEFNSRCCSLCAALGLHCVGVLDRE